MDIWQKMHAKGLVSLKSAVHKSMKRSCEENVLDKKRQILEDFEDGLANLEGRC